MTGIPTTCTRCALALDVNNITGVCLECKHIERDHRRGYTSAEVPLDEARANFMDAFRGNYRPLDDSAVYMRGACRKCARFVARHDTGKCDWCSRPWRPRAPKRTKKAARPKVQTSAHSPSATRVPQAAGKCEVYFTSESSVADEVDHDA